jgi:S-formylglutathione hydrolase FrmB
MGGYGAMNIAMQNPGVFGQVVSIAGYFVVNDLSGMFGGPVTVHVQPGTHDWAYAMSALRYSFTFLADNWRQAAANDESGVP